MTLPVRKENSWGIRSGATTPRKLSVGYPPAGSRCRKGSTTSSPETSPVSNMLTRLTKKFPRAHRDFRRGMPPIRRSGCERFFSFSFFVALLMAITGAALVFMSMALSSHSLSDSYAKYAPKGFGNSTELIKSYTSWQGPKKDQSVDKFIDSETRERTTAFLGSSSSHSYPPRIAFYDATNPNQQQRSRSMHDFLSQKKLEINDPMLVLEPPSEQKYRAAYVQGNCIPMASWQVDSRPTCNVIHEIDLIEYTIVDTAAANLEESGTGTFSEWAREVRSSRSEGTVEFLGQGWFRMAWKLHTGTTATHIKAGANDGEEGTGGTVTDPMDSSVHHVTSPSVILKTLR